MDFLFRAYIDGDWGKYNKLLQEIKEKYIKGVKVIHHKWHGNLCILNYCSGPDNYLASYPGLLTPVFVACSSNAREGLVKLIMCNDIHGCWVDVWRSGTFPEKQQVSECATDCKHRP